LRGLCEACCCASEDAAGAAIIKEDPDEQLIQLVVWLEDRVATTKSINYYLYCERVCCKKSSKNTTPIQSVASRLYSRNE
jgi:hypothetical protein